MSAIDMLFQLFIELPPRFIYIETLLCSHTYTCETINDPFCKFVEECSCEYRDFADKHGRKPSEEQIHSNCLELSIGIPLYCKSVVGKPFLLY